MCCCGFRQLTSSDYFIPVLGIIFLRHAANRFDAATRQIAADQVLMLDARSIGQLMKGSRKVYEQNSVFDLERANVSSKLDSLKS